MENRVPASVSSSDSAATRDRLNRLAWLLDSSIPIPGLKFRFGLDALLGLVPVLGDVVGMVVSGYIMREAAQLGAPRTLIVRMGFNVMVEGLIGMVPFVGDLFDAAWKANQRNVRLLNNFLDNPRRTTATSRGFVFLLAVVLIAFVAGTAIASFLLLRWIWQAIGA